MTIKDQYDFHVAAWHGEGSTIYYIIRTPADPENPNDWTIIHSLKAQDGYTYKDALASAEQIRFLYQNDEWEQSKKGTHK